MSHLLPRLVLCIALLAAQAVQAQGFVGLGLDYPIPTCATARART
jgi:hypothetical protein